MPINHMYRDAIAVLSLSPARPGEVMPGQRPSGLSKGVAVFMDVAGDLVLMHKPLKTREGRFGMDRSAITLKITEAGPTAEYLAQRCRENDDDGFTVAIRSASALAKAINRIGRKAFPNGPLIGPYVYRAQHAANLEAAFGAGAQVAAALGHSTDKTQHRYGNVRHGRRGGLIRVQGSGKPRLVAVERARKLATERKEYRAPEAPSEVLRMGLKNR